MASIYLAPYAITIRKNHTKEELVFNSVFTNPVFLTVVSSFFDKLKSGFYDDESASSIFKVSNKEVIKSAASIHGIIESGAYGFESKFYDRNGSHKYSRQKDHAEVMPFYFMVYVPQNSKVGFIILQRFGQYGISKSFNDMLKNYIKGIVPGYQIEIEPVVSTKVLHKIIDEGRIKRAIFTKYAVPKNLEDYFSSNGPNQEGYLQMSLVASRNSQLNLKERLKKIMFGTDRLDSLLKIKNFTYDEMKVNIEYGGGQRTISVGDRSFRAFYDISDTVTRNADGHPNFTSIKRIASELVTELDQMV